MQHPVITSVDCAYRLYAAPSHNVSPLCMQVELLGLVGEGETGSYPLTYTPMALVASGAGMLEGEGDNVRS
jgi:hypothetical protein